MSDIEVGLAEQRIFTEFTRIYVISGREFCARDGAIDLLERILGRDNLNKAYKQVKSNHGAPGIDGMTVEAALPWLRENREELLQSIRDGRYKPSPVQRKEILKPDGSGVRKLGIPTVVDRVIQQAIAQQLQPLFEPLFWDGSYGYRRGRSAQQAIRRVKAYAEQGYEHVVEIGNRPNQEILEKRGYGKRECAAKRKKALRKAVPYRRYWPTSI